MSEEKRTRKSFEEAKAERVAAIEKKLADARARVAKLEADLETEKARTRKSRPMTDKAKAKKLGDMVANSSASKEKKIEAMKILGIDIPEELL